MLAFNWALAQNQHDKVWVFGQNAGINFNTTPPIGIQFIMRPPNVIYTALEADANVCDKNGNVLFY